MQPNSTTFNFYLTTQLLITFEDIFCSFKTTTYIWTIIDHTQYVQKKFDHIRRTNKTT
jgi:hypothetical protein